MHFYDCLESTNGGWLENEHSKYFSVCSPFPASITLDYSDSVLCLEEQALCERKKIIVLLLWYTAVFWLLWNYHFNHNTSSLTAKGKKKMHICDVW